MSDKISPTFDTAHTTEEVAIKITIEFTPAATSGRQSMSRADFHSFVQNHIDQHPNHEITTILKNYLEIQAGADTHAQVPTQIVRLLGNCGRCTRLDGNPGSPDYTMPGNYACFPC